MVRSQNAGASLAILRETGNSTVRSQKGWNFFWQIPEAGNSMVKSHKAGTSMGKSQKLEILWSDLKRLELLWVNSRSWKFYG